VYLLTELPGQFAQIRGRGGAGGDMVPARDRHRRWRQDIASSLVVPRVGSLVVTGDVWEPYWLPDQVGARGRPGRGVFAGLQAAGRSAATQRSYGMDLLRWFRFLWTIEVPWNQVTRVEARDVTRWVQITDKPTRPGAGLGTPNAVTGDPDQAEVRVEHPRTYRKRAARLL